MKKCTKWIPKMGDWFILKASYCDKRNDINCTDAHPCQECLDMCNRFVISGEHYGKDFFFGGGWCNRDGGHIMNDTYSGVLTFNKDIVDGIACIHHVSEAVHIPSPEETRLHGEIKKLKAQLRKPKIKL